jgi:hypothetical protein
MGDQPLVELAGEERDAVGPRVMTKPVAGEANLAAAGGKQHLLIEVGPLLNGRVERHRVCVASTSVLARIVLPGELLATPQLRSIGVDGGQSCQNLLQIVVR